MGDYRARRLVQVSPYGVTSKDGNMCQAGGSEPLHFNIAGGTMDPDALLKTILDNPTVSGLVGTVAAAVAGFCRPILRALQAALIRRIDRAWVAENDEADHAERVRKTANRVHSNTRMPLTRNFIEDQVRAHKSLAPPPS